MTIVDDNRWTTFLDDHPEAHLLQSAEWGRLKEGFGWRAFRLVQGDTGAQVLFRRLPMGFTLAYIPKGPVGNSWQALWPELDQLCRAQRAVFLKVEPDGWEPLDDELSRQLAGWLPTDPIQPRRTIEVDLSAGLDHVLARMKQKTRYNIHLAQRKDVRVQHSEDLEGFHRMMLITGQRDGFGVHTLSYYRQAYQLFKPKDKVALLCASYHGQPLAALMVFRQGSRAWYFYGASNNTERGRMPAYLLQWKAMRWAAERGCQVYDLWGIPDVEEEVLEREFAGQSGGLWGVYRFKRGFGGVVRRSPGAWDRVYQPLLYRFYRLLSRWRRGIE